MSFKNWLLLILLSLVWGGSFYFVENAFEHFTFEQIVFFRVFFATLFILAVLIVKKIKIVLSLKLWMTFLVMSCLNNVIPFLAITYAQETITASLASLFNATTPIFTAILANFLTKDEKLTWLKSIGILVGFVGMIILLQPDAFSTFESASFFAIAGAISYACAGVYGKRLKEHDPMLSVFGMLSCSSLIIYILFSSSINAVDVSSLYAWQDLIWLALFSTTIAYIIYFKLLFSIGAVKLLLVTYLIPISASFLGVFLLDEKFTSSMIVGSGFIFASLWLINKEKK